MPKNNLDQAPRIKNNGEKKLKNLKNGFAMRPHDLETILFNLIDTKNVVQLKVMLFVTGNAEGFKLVQEATLKRLGISKDPYYKARRALVERGWLSIEEEEDKTYIVVNYDKIYNDGKEFLEKEGNCENTTDEGNSQNTFVEESTFQNTAHEGNCENTTLQEKKEGNCENTTESTLQNTTEGYSDNYYNRINEKNKEYDKEAARKEFDKMWGVDNFLTGAAAMF